MPKNGMFHGKRQGGGVPSLLPRSLHPPHGCLRVIIVTRDDKIVQQPNRFN
jgi:hypothetical protein